MNPDDPVCLCFHVSRRKVVNFIRIEKPKRPSQLSQCFGAGTGCGWCRPYLERLLNESLLSNTPRSPEQKPPANDTGSPAAEDTPEQELTLEQYKKARSAYVRQGGGTPPPGAEPIEALEESSDSGASPESD